MLIILVTVGGNVSSTQNESYVSKLDFEKTPYKHATMIFNNFDVTL